MARRKRHDKINALALQEIARHASLLRIALVNAQMGLTPFRPHYDALSRLGDDLQTAINLLNDRPADYREPHRGHMAQG